MFISHALTIQNSHRVIADLVREKSISQETAEAIVETVQQTELVERPATKSDLAEMEARVVTKLLLWIISFQVASTGLLLATRLLG